LNSQATVPPVFPSELFVTHQSPRVPDERRPDGRGAFLMESMTDEVSV